MAGRPQHMLLEPAEPLGATGLHSLSPPEPCWDSRMDAILPTPTYRGQVVFYWSKSLAFHSEGGAPRGDSGGEGVGGCSRPLWNGGGWWYPDAAGQTQGHRNAEQVLATELGRSPGRGLCSSVEERKPRAVCP